jgi:hypothetical protein
MHLREAGLHITRKAPDNAKRIEERNCPQGLDKRMVG